MNRGWFLIVRHRDYPSGNPIIYLPNGAYVVSQQIEFGISRRRRPGKNIDGRDPSHQRLTILQGESRDKKIIKLQDNCAMWYAGFGEVVMKPGMRIVDSPASIVCHRQHSFGSGQ
jgi:hypothetical protein